MFQLSCYDQIKQVLMTYLPSVFRDNVHTHFTSSFIAVSINLSPKCKIKDITGFITAHLERRK